MTIQKEPTRINSDLRTKLFNSALPGQLPTDIQWMPAGPQNICPFIEGSPVPIKIEVNEELANELNAQLQQMRSDAGSGQGDVPFIDFNHEDAEAAGEVLSLYWAGNDPVTGGIRAKIKWSDAGIAALKGKMYRRFSPAWLVDKDTYQPLGIGVNVGGLVNRAAFQNIAPIVAKSGEPGGVALPPGLAQALGGDASRFVRILNATLAPVYQRVQALQDSMEASEDLTAVATATQAAASATPQNHPFVVEARVIAAREKISELDARVRLASANYPLYRDYMIVVQAADRTRRQTRIVRTPAEKFLVEVRALQATGAGFQDACSTVSAKRPDLYEGYRQAVTARGK